MSNVKELKHLSTKSDEWDAVLQAFGTELELIKTNHVVPIRNLLTRAELEKIKYYDDDIINTTSYTTKNVLCLNKHKEVVRIFYNAEIVDGEICVHKPYNKQSYFPWSWLNWMFRPRVPPVNVNASFSSGKRKNNTSI